VIFLLLDSREKALDKLSKIAPYLLWNFDFYASFSQW